MTVTAAHAEIDMRFDPESSRVSWTRRAGSDAPAAAVEICRPKPIITYAAPCMPSQVIVDTGPLVAFFDADDDHHASCVSTLKGLTQSLVTLWPAVTEALHLLAFSSIAQQGLLSWLAESGAQLAPLSPSDIPRIQELLRRYKDLPMDFTDAALIAVAERDNIKTVFTVDKRDFHIYRPRHVRMFHLLPPP